MFNSKERTEMAEKSYLENGGYQRCVEELVAENLIKVLRETDDYILARCTQDAYYLFDKYLMNKHHRLYYSAVDANTALSILNIPKEKITHREYLFVPNREYSQVVESLKKDMKMARKAESLQLSYHKKAREIDEKIEELKRSGSL